MMNKSMLLAVLVIALSGCLPYNNAYYGAKPTGYYQNSYNNQMQYPYNNAMNQPSSQNNFEDDLEDIGYNANETIDSQYSVMNNAHSIPVQQVKQQTVYQELPQNPMAQQQFRTPRTPYYNPSLSQAPQIPEMQNSRGNGVVGIGNSLEARQTPINRNEKLKLIMPSSWRMAHPSIGKGLEVANEAERFEFNRVLNIVNVKNPADIFIGAKPVTVIGLTNNGVSNSQGFLCKDVYLLQANRDKVEKMWGKFCRHPNWNEWVLTNW